LILGFSPHLVLGQGIPFFLDKGWKIVILNTTLVSVTMDTSRNIDITSSSASTLLVAPRPSLALFLGFILILVNLLGLGLLLIG